MFPPTTEMVFDRLCQCIRLGFVTARQPEKMRLQVEIKDSPGGRLVTKFLPMLTPRATGDMQYDLPDIGDQVLVLFLPYALEQGFVLGAMYGGNNPPTTNPEVWHRTFADGTVLEYDRGAHKLKADVKGELEAKATGVAALKSEKQVEVEAPTIFLLGNIINTGLDGSPGTSVFSGVMEVLNGGLKVLDGDVVAAGVSLASHAHDGVEPGSGTSSFPSGGSATSPGTGAVDPGSMTEEEREAQIDRTLADLDTLVADGGNKADKVIACLPAIASNMASKADAADKDSEAQGWRYLAAMFRRWLSGIQNEDAAKGGAPFEVSWDWLMRFGRVQEAVEKLEGNRLFTPNSRALLLKRLEERNLLGKERVPFNFIHPAQEPGDKADWLQWPEVYFQSATIERSSFPQFVGGDITADGLQTAMASFMIYALAKGYAQQLEKGEYEITVEEVALVAYDRFNFQGKDDYRYWSCARLDFTPVYAAGYTHLTNEEFTSFRDEFHRGNDFIVTSPLKDIAFGAPYVYTIKP